MSFLQTLESSLFTENIRWVTITVGNVTHTIPMDTILNFPRSLRLSSLILHYCAIKDENPDKASSIFSGRHGILFSHILHYADTQHLVYPSDLELTKTLVRDLCRYGLIRIKDGYCHQCLMEYFKVNGLDDFRNDQSNEIHDENATYPFLKLTPETVIIRSENAGGEIFSLRGWGTPRTLDELFPKGVLENDSNYFQLSMRVTIIHTDLCKFLKELADIVCCVVKKLGFRATCYSTWSDDSRIVHYGQWLLYRQLPAIVPVASTVTAVPVIRDTSPPVNLSKDPQPSPPPPPPPIIYRHKKKWNWCPCLTKSVSVDVDPLKYPDIPPKDPHVPVEGKRDPPRTPAVEVNG